MAVAIAVGLVVIALILMFVVVARESGPSPEDTAIAYELAWNRLDFSTLYDLSAAELRDGMARDEFVAAKRASLSGRASERADAVVALEQVDSSSDAARAVTSVTLESETVRNHLGLARRNGRWVVVRYSLAPESSGDD